MNIDLIEIEKYNDLTAIVILDEYIDKLGKVLIMDANISDEYLFKGSFGNPIFKRQLDELSKNNDFVYFVIKKIDEIDYDLQNRYIGLVKDREFLGYNLPSNVKIVFTICSDENIKKISKDLYHFCTVVF